MLFNFWFFDFTPSNIVGSILEDEVKLNKQILGFK